MAWNWSGQDTSLAVIGFGRGPPPLDGGGDGVGGAIHLAVEEPQRRARLLLRVLHAPAERVRLGEGRGGAGGSIGRGEGAGRETQHSRTKVEAWPSLSQR